MTAPVKLSRARQRGLEVLDRHGSCRRSNYTCCPNMAVHAGAVYWQTADWLIEHGYAVEPVVNRIELSDAGRNLLAALR